MAFGCLLTLIGYHFGNIDNNSVETQVIVQKVVPIVDEIRCRSLVIVGDDDTPCITLNTNLFDGGQINIYNEDGTRRIWLGVASNYDSGGLEISGKESGSTAVMLGTDNEGGFMALFNKVLDKPVIQASITIKGEGFIFTRDEVGNQIDVVGPIGRSTFKEKTRN